MLEFATEPRCPYIRQSLDTGQKKRLVSARVELNNYDVIRGGFVRGPARV